MAGLVQNATGTTTNTANTTTDAASALNASKQYYTAPIQVSTATPRVSQGGSAVTPPQPTPIAAAGYTPTDWTISKDQTVEGRLANLTSDTNNPLMVQAQTQAKQEAAKRGLVNSSIAVSAGQDAMLKNALPIAQQDASTAATASQFNANSRNAAAQFGAAAGNTAALTSSDVASREKIAQLSNESQQFVAQLNANTSLANAKLSADSQLALANLDNATKTNLQNIVSSNSQLLQANTSAANVAAQYMSSIANIQANDKLDAAAKQTAINNMIGTMNQSLAVIGGIAGLDLSKYFQTETPVVTPEPVTNTLDRP